MNKNDLFKSIGEIDEQTLHITECYRPRKTNYLIGLIAASLAIICTVFGFLYFRSPDTSDRSAPNLFVITAQAVGGEWGELGLNNGFFNSGPSNDALFDTDFPLFDFIIEPTNPEYGQDTFWNCSIVISYNGVVCDSLEDDHLHVFYLIPGNGSGASYKYNIVGWFEEETDMTITITDRDRGGEVIEEFTVNVCYVADSQAYRLTVTDIRTNDILSGDTAYHYQMPDRSQYQLTQTQLNAPTDVLIDYILDYPYLVDLYCSNSSDVDAYTKLCEVFNGLAELEKRDDAATVMLYKLSTSPVEDDSLRSLHLQTLLAVPTYLKRLTEAELAEYLRITCNASIISGF